MVNDDCAAVAVCGLKLTTPGDFGIGYYILRTWNVFNVVALVFVVCVRCLLGYAVLSTHERHPAHPGSSVV